MKTKRFKPTLGQKYWFVLISIASVFRGGTHWTKYESQLDNEYYKIGNCFKTRKEAQAKLKKIKKILKERL